VCLGLFNGGCVGFDFFVVVLGDEFWVDWSLFFEGLWFYGLVSWDVYF
jgi:hypothetical protein